jgi:hypothetical protein
VGFSAATGYRGGVSKTSGAPAWCLSGFAGRPRIGLAGPHSRFAGVS